MTVSIQTALARFPRIALFTAPTPIQRLERLEHGLGDACRGIKIFVKRDDHMELGGGGGNKLRKLEFHLGAAQAEGADTLITVGGVQSNHARLTAAAAAKLGLACELMLSRAVPRAEDGYEDNGNVLLDHLFGAHVSISAAGSDPFALAQQRAKALRAAGRKVYVMPSGGSTALGALGYVRCALEIVGQEEALGECFREVVVANGSGGTHAGLAAGFTMLDRGAATVRSYSVLADPEPTRQKTLQLARDTLQLLGDSRLPGEETIDVDGAFRGPGYGLPTDPMIEAVRLLAAHEGLLLDPVYSGKAFAGLLAAIRQGRYTPGDSVLFVMTGGTPGLYVYQSVFRQAD
ncbi:D-cysteine desulfhydrase family protein [Paraburkholderia sp. 2C]|jgi:L-cysteate sulfo-lyase